ncbi:uncharacterized protein LOC143021379 [Oratosquilla oratoria]|uniref:uncharacterized protein LOC143021379 n=1 Tax=Oratosquilla oratoria TaxID=337810 RepID=UPI003F7632B6
MKSLLLVVLAGVATAQQIPAVQLALPGSFESGAVLSNNGGFQVDDGSQQIRASFKTDPIKLGQSDDQQSTSNFAINVNSKNQLGISNQFESGFLFQGQGNNNQFKLEEGFGTIINGRFEPLNLPAGASLILGTIDTSFTCADRPYGYYADQGNDCRVFHVCNPYLFEDGRIETVQYSFMCGEGSVFDQKELTCADQLAALSCQEAANFYFRNEEFGLLDEKL